jgi:hypothetical protein
MQIGAIGDIQTSKPPESSIAQDVCHHLVRTQSGNFNSAAGTTKPWTLDGEQSTAFKVPTATNSAMSEESL